MGKEHERARKNARTLYGKRRFSRPVGEILRQNAGRPPAIPYQGDAGVGIRLMVRLDFAIGVEGGEVWAMIQHPF